jgi:NitT/TauT family transport system substrate-binding protein
MEHEHLGRRAFVTGLTLTGSAGWLGARACRVDAEPAPETTTLRLFKFPVACFAPYYLAEDLLRAEGFTDVQYVNLGPSQTNLKALGGGDIHFTITDIHTALLHLDGAPASVLLLAGIHGGCYELFVTNGVRTVRELKGRIVSVANRGRQAFVSSIAAWIGLDPHKDIDFIIQPASSGMELFAQGTVDAFMGFPPDPQELRGRKIGTVLVDTKVDRPWAQYLCCFLAANPAFVRKHPVATKRAMRAMLKAIDICAADPDRAARALLGRGYTARPEFALQAIREIPYNLWRGFNPSDTVRFHAIRLHEVGIIKSTPQTVIAQGTDWRFLDGLKTELKS